MFAIRVECCIFPNLYGRCVLRCESFSTIFSLYDATDRSKISAFFIALSLYPLSFFANTPFNDDFLKIFFVTSDSQKNVLFLCPGGLDKKICWKSELWIVPADFKKKIKNIYFCGLGKVRTEEPVAFFANPWFWQIFMTYFKIRIVKNPQTDFFYFYMAKYVFWDFFKKVNFPQGTLCNSLWFKKKLENL